MSVVVTGPSEIRLQKLISGRKRFTSRTDIVYCGKLLSCSDVLSGHGTFTTQNGLAASVSGLKVQYSRLYLVEPYKSKYFPKVGDVVVGRIVSAQKARWKVNINCRMCAILHLNNVNLPGGELRRKGLEDEVAMSEHLVVGDMVSAEVQQVRMRGQVYLHTRNLKYGKLGQGIMIKVFPSLVKPQKEYMHEMFGIGVIIGCNGMIWISSTLSSEANGGYSEDLTLVLPIEKRESMVRLAACIRMLAKSLICIYDVSILSAYSASINYQVKDLAHINVISLLIPKIVEIIAAEEKRRMEEKDREELARKRRFL